MQLYFFTVKCEEPEGFQGKRCNTPIHLLSLDYYNRSNAKFNSRIRLISDLYKTTTFARVLRLSWSFGVGGLANTKIKNYLN